MNAKSRTIALLTAFALALASFLAPTAVAPAPAAAATGADTSWASADANWVRQLYIDVLGRSGGTDEVAGWLADMAAGKTRGEVAEGFIFSQEYLQRVARQVYVQVAGAEPSSEQLTAAVASLRSTRSATELRIALLGRSSVFAPLTTTAWITKAYAVLAGRAPTAAEVAQRTSELTAGQTHHAVARNIAAQPGARLWAFNAIYTELLQRQATSGERMEYAGAAVFADLSYRRTAVLSGEYDRRANIAAYGCYVRALYQAVLGRTPADGEVAGWTADYVSKGGSRYDTARGFVRSQESQDRIIRATFAEVLGRAPTQDDLAKYRGIMSDPTGNDHWSVTQLSVWLVVSAEFRAKHPGRDWIRELYRIFDGRIPSESEIDHWYGQLRDYDVTANTFAMSEEARTYRVKRIYQEVLGVAPSSQESARYVDLLGTPPRDPTQNEEFMLYALSILPAAVVGQVAGLILSGLGVPAIVILLVGVPGAVQKAETLVRLASHPMHDMDLTGRVLASDAFYRRAVVDTTPPTTTPRLAGTAGGSGWYRSAVTLTLAATDTGAGSCPGRVAITEYRIGSGPWQRYTAPVVVNAEGVSQVSFRSKDEAGNTEPTRTVQVKIDTTPPSISGATTTAPNAAGWYRTDVTVRFSASDSGSGLASVTGDQLLRREGAGQSVVGAAVDRAGNRATATVAGINIDRTAPVVSVTSPVAGPYPKSSPATVRWTASDALSGLAAQSADLDGTPVANGQVLDLLLLPAGQHTLTVRATDRAGNAGSTAVVFTVTVDAKTLPAVVQRMVQVGWITKPGIGKSLQAKLAAAGASLARGDVPAALHQLAALRNELRAQDGKAITPQAVAVLEADVRFILGR